MGDKSDRNPWEDRYDRDDDDTESVESVESLESSKRSKMSETTKSTETAETTETEETSETETVRDRKNVNMYLPEGLVDDLQLRYSELNVEWQRRHGSNLPKNQEFYPAVIRAALGDSSVSGELGLEDE